MKSIYTFTRVARIKFIDIAKQIVLKKLNIVKQIMLTNLKILKQIVFMKLKKNLFSWGVPSSSSRHRRAAVELRRSRDCVVDVLKRLTSSESCGSLELDEKTAAMLDACYRVRSLYLLFETLIQHSKLFSND